MAGQQRSTLADQASGCAELQIGIDPRLERHQPQLLEALNLALHEVLKAHIRKRRPTPQRERRSQPLARHGGLADVERTQARRDQRLEPLGVELPRAQRQHVAAADRPQPRDTISLKRLKRAAKPRDRHAEPLARATTNRPPDPLDHRVARHGSIRVQNEKPKQRQLPRPAERHRFVPEPGLDRSENPEPHNRPHHCITIVAMTAVAALLPRCCRRGG